MTNDTLSSMQLEVLSLDPLSAAIPLEDWQTLCAAALSPNPFFGPDFLRPFLEKMSKQAVRLVVVREQPGGRWLVAAPVGRRRFGLAVAVNTTWASEYAPLGTPLIHPGRKCRGNRRIHQCRPRARECARYPLSAASFPVGNALGGRWARERSRFWRSPSGRATAPEPQASHNLPRLTAARGARKCAG